MEFTDYGKITHTKDSVVAVQVSTYFGDWPSVVIHRNGHSRIYKHATIASTIRIVSLLAVNNIHSVTTNNGAMFYL